MGRRKTECWERVLRLLEGERLITKNGFKGGNSITSAHKWPFIGPRLRRGGKEINGVVMFLNKEK